MNQLCLPVCDKNNQIIRGNSLLVKSINNCLEHLDKILEREQIEDVEEITTTNRLDDRADSVIEELETTISEAGDEFRNWRSPHYTGRFKVDDRVDELREMFETTRCILYAENIKELIERLISLGYQERHFVLTHEDDDGKKKSLDFREICRKMKLVQPKDRPQYLYQLIVTVKPIIPTRINWQVTRVEEPSIMDSNVGSR